MAVTKDWHAWQETYANASSPPSRRLRLVRRHIASWLDDRRGEELTAVSACAGQGHDLPSVLVTRADAHRVHATLLEADERNVAVAQAAAADPPNVTVVQPDAGDLAEYVGSVPADLVLMAGVFGNVSDADVYRTINALPHMCAPAATLIWTRSRRTPDLTPTVRCWLAEAGFMENAFRAPEGVLFSVGVSRYTGVPVPLSAPGRLFHFVT